MSEPTPDRHDAFDNEVMEPEDDLGLQRRRSEHGGMPRGNPEENDEDLEVAVERDRVAAGLADYAPDDVPPATDPLPPGTSEAVDRAQRALDEPDEG